jgi:DNA polymerase III subunit beta
MKVIVQQQNLLPAVSAAARSSGVRTTLPVLANILLQSEGTILRLHATNLEVGVIKMVECEVVEEGDITVPARTFLDIVSSLQGAKITLESEGDQLLVTTDSFHGSINGISATEFPPIPLASEKSVSVAAALLRESLPEIAFAAASEDGRPILTGILTEIKKNTLELVATDGFRLAHKTASLKDPIGEGFRYLIPRRTFEEVIRLIGEDSKGKDDVVEISTSENQNQIIFSIGNTKLSSRLIEGQFPTWERIVPTAFVANATVDRGELLKAVKLSSVFAKGETANVIKLQTGTKQLLLSSEARELGTQETQVEAVVEGEAITIAFNARFLVDALSNCSDPKINIQFSGNLSPAVIKPVEESGLEYVIMPVRLS